MRVIKIIYYDLVNCSIILSISFFILCFAKTPNTAPIFPNLRSASIFISVLESDFAFNSIIKTVPLVSPSITSLLSYRLGSKMCFTFCFISFPDIETISSVSICLSDCSAILKALYLSGNDVGSLPISLITEKILS